MSPVTKDQGQRVRGEGQRGHTLASRNRASLGGALLHPYSLRSPLEDSLTHLLSHLLCRVTCLHFLVEILQIS